MAKPKNPILSFLDSSTEDAAELEAWELAITLETALGTEDELAGAAPDDAGPDAAALAAIELVELPLEPEPVDDELHAARVNARAAVPAARSFVVRFTLVTP